MKISRFSTMNISSNHKYFLIYNSFSNQSGSGVIVIQLGQPYCIDSLRLLLWDCDMRTYSFYIETSINQKDWEMAVDKQEEQLRSWQSFIFTPRPVVFIKIVGTHNTANEVKFQFFYFKYLYVITFPVVYFRSFTVYILNVHHKICQNSQSNQHLQAKRPHRHHHHFHYQ